MNGVNRVTVRRSAEEWRAIVSRFERSGQTSRQFCSAEQLAPSTFALWRRRLRGPAAGSESNGAARFVELSDSPPAAAWTGLGAERVGAIQSLLTTCRMQGVNPYTYLVDVLQRIDRHPAKRVIELTPRVWKALFAENPLRSDLDRVRDPPAQ